MKLTPGEQDRLTLFTVAELARRRLARGTRLSHPEAIGLICDEVLEVARDGATFADAVSHGCSLLNEDQVLDGVPDMIPIIQVEVRFNDGTKLVTMRNPIRQSGNPQR